MPSYDYEVQLRWSDADRLGHVNNSRLATFAEDARLQWFMTRDGVDPSSSSLILARQEIDYWRQMRTEDDPRIVIKTSVLSIGRTSVRIIEQVWGQHDTTPAATVTCVLVHFDYEQQTSTPWSDEDREWLSSYVEQA